MNRWLAVVVLVVLVLAGAMGLRNMTTAKAGSVIMANGGGPIPPDPWLR